MTFANADSSAQGKQILFFDKYERVIRRDNYDFKGLIKMSIAFCYKDTLQKKTINGNEPIYSKLQIFNQKNYTKQE